MDLSAKGGDPSAMDSQEESIAWRVSDSVVLAVSVLIIVFGLIIVWRFIIQQKIYKRLVIFFYVCALMIEICVFAQCIILLTNLGAEMDNY